MIDVATHKMTSATTTDSEQQQPNDVTEMIDSLSSVALQQQVKCDTSSTNNSSEGNDCNNHRNGYQHQSEPNQYPPKQLPVWKYHGVEKKKDAMEILTKHNNNGNTAVTTRVDDNVSDIFENNNLPSLLYGPSALNLGSYSRSHVTNCYNTTSDNDSNTNSNIGKQYFDLGLRLMVSYHHEFASTCFLLCLKDCPNCALAHGLLALCHSPNYNFKGEAYYYSACHYDDINQHDLMCTFPSQQVADRHSKLAMEKMDELRKLNRNNGNNNNNTKRRNGTKPNHKKNHRSNNKQQQKGLSSSSSNTGVPNEEDGTSNNGTNVSSTSENTNTTMISTDIISDIETQFLSAIRILTCQPGIDPDLSEEIVGRPYAIAMSKLYAKYPQDPEIAYFYAESLMVLNAWKLYNYPSGKPASPDVDTAKDVLQRSLELHPHHAGLCHMYVHLSEMSANPGQALVVCDSLRYQFPHAGHLIHMVTHIDVLVGHYENCVTYNCKARDADLHIMKYHPEVAGTETFYFGYIAHDYHMGVYGAILGGYEKIAMSLANEINSMVNETTFEQYPDLVSYLETYASLEIHVMIRFGRWDALLQLPLPKNEQLMLYRTASIRYGRALAYTMTGDIPNAVKEEQLFDTIRHNPESSNRILHNNTVSDLLNVDSTMMHGEILYKCGRYEEGLKLLKQAVKLQDDLNYDEPWGKMQPIRHAYGGLLYEQGHVDEAIDVFKTDLTYHPNNPWALIGLIKCYQSKLSQMTNRNNNPTDHVTATSTAMKSTIASAATTTSLEPEVEATNEHLQNDRVSSSCCSENTSDKKDNNKTIAVRSNNTKRVITCNKNGTTGTGTSDMISILQHEIQELKQQLQLQRQSQYADYEIVVPCECCQKSGNSI